MRTPAGRRVGEPANARPRTVPHSAIRTATTTERRTSTRREARRVRPRLAAVRKRAPSRKLKSLTAASYDPGRARPSSEREELDPAADVQGDARDVGSEIGAEKRDRIRDLLRLA